MKLFADPCRYHEFEKFFSFLMVQEDIKIIERLIFDGIHHCCRASRQYQIWRSAHIKNLSYPDLEPFGFESVNNEIKIKLTTKMS